MKKVLPFHTVRPKQLFTKRASKRIAARKRGLRALVKQFGYQDVLRELVSMACDESLLALKTRDAHGHLYGEAFAILDHAEKTLSTIVRLNAQLAQDPKKTE